MTELAWAAGFFDGEGSTILDARPGRKVSLKVQVAQTEPTVLERFRKAVGVGNINGPYRRNEVNQADYWQFRVQGAGALDVLKALWPFLSYAKRDQALLRAGRVALNV
jgi:hypothetical protein